MKYNNEYQFFDKLMSIFGINMVNLYKRLTPRNIVPFAQPTSVHSDYQVHVEQQSVNSMNPELYEKFKAMFRIGIQKGLIIQCRSDLKSQDDKLMYFDQANYKLYDTNTLKFTSNVLVASFNVLDKFNVLDNDLCEQFQTWIKMDVNDIPCCKEMNHLTGTYQQLEQFVKYKTALTGSKLGLDTINFMKQNGITKGNLFLLTPEESLETMKIDFDNKSIPNINIGLERYLIDVVQDVPQLKMDKIFINTVGQEIVYSTKKYQTQFEKKYKENSIVINKTIL